MEITNPEEFKNLLLLSCKGYYRREIESLYPNHTQHNLIAGIEDGLDDFKQYVSDVKDEFAVLKDAIAAIDSTAIVDNFHTDSDENMMQYVVGYMPTLTTTRQKYAIILGIQHVLYS